jgi:hypothetical protein
MSTVEDSAESRLTSHTAPRKLWPWLLAAVVAFALVSAGAWFLTRSDPAPPATSTTTIEGAYVACEDAVRLRLKAPGTAQFGGRQASTTNPNQIPIYVTGWVDAENSFGALLRMEYECTVGHDERGWLVSELTVT